MPAAGYAYAIDPRIIDKSLKRRLIVKAQDKKFVQCVSPINIKIKQPFQKNLEGCLFEVLQFYKPYGCATGHDITP